MILLYLCDAVPTTEYAIVNPIVCINNLKKREIMKIHELEEQLDCDALNSINSILAKLYNVELSGNIRSLDECADDYNHLVKEAEEWDKYFGIPK